MKIYVNTDINNIVTSYSIKLSDAHVCSGVLVYTELDLEQTEILGKYKIENEQLVELTEEEKETNKIDICPVKTTEEKLSEAEEKIVRLEEQVKASNEQQEFYENCIVEMAELVYA